MPPTLDPQLVFERYIVGSGNRLAAAAARRAAEAPGRSYNPLVVCGPPGLGKTHLLTAIGHLAHAVDPELVVRYEPADAFVDRLTSSISAGTVEQLREASTGVGLWLLDDLQNLGGKARTQEELLRIWEAMIARGAQIVVALDRPLAEVPALDGRLASRLAGGLSVDISAPDSETRLGILRQTIAERGFPLPSEVIDALAALPIDNVRELQGALNRLVAAVDIEERRVGAGDVATLLGLDLHPAPAPQDEFGAFLTDISAAVAAVVETAPWRRRLAEAILRWEGEGVRTRRLEEALDADSAPDVDALLSAFARDVGRLRQIASLLPSPPAEAGLLSDPDRLREAEALLAASAAGPAERTSAAPPPAATAGAAARVDPWFLDHAKLVWHWMALDERLLEEER
jgi:hypothetical protein